MPVIKLSTTRKLDYIPRLVDANKPYRMGVAGDTDKARYWTPGVVLDQGQEGACVGFGTTGEAIASPARVKFNDVSHSLSPTDLGNQIARVVYDRAKEIDEWEGVDYEGTSVRAGMLVGRERGWYTGFRWALNMGELRAALDLGPVVIGVTWLEDMYEAPGGIVTVSGPEVGGHCLLLTGYTPAHRKLNYEPAYRWRNSWGGGPNGYGANGSAYIRASDLDRILFQAGGEAAVPIGRAA